LAHGAYVVSPQKGEQPEAILIASGSEVSLSIEAQQRLAAEGKDVSVVSMPDQKEFDRQSAEYKESVLPNDVRKRVSVEMGVTQTWGKYVGLDGISLGISTFGESGNGAAVVERFGFTPEKVAAAVNSLF
jgi:Transketolase